MIIDEQFIIRVPYKMNSPKSGKLPLLVDVISRVKSLEELTADEEFVYLMYIENF